MIQDDASRGLQNHYLLFETHQKSIILYIYALSETFLKLIKILYKNTYKKPKNLNLALSLTLAIILSLIDQNIYR
jgi:hypothetical protein